jgi:hypothetical protein
MKLKRNHESFTESQWVRRSDACEMSNDAPRGPGRGPGGLALGAPRTLPPRAPGAARGELLLNRAAWILLLSIFGIFNLNLQPLLHLSGSDESQWVRIRAK